MLCPRTFYWVVILLVSFAALSGEVRASNRDPQPPFFQAALMVNPESIDFGSVILDETKTGVVTVSNRGTETLTFSAVVSNGSDFTIVSQPSTLTLSPGMSTTFTAGFRPSTPSLISNIGTITITSNGGNFVIPLRGRGIETTAPIVRVTSPVGGETIEAGKATLITFVGSDNDQISAFSASYSINGGGSFIDIGIAAGTTSPGEQVTGSIPWNVPDGLKTDQAVIRVTAVDRSGNRTSVTSGLFRIDSPTSTQPSISITICFDPPKPPEMSSSNPRICSISCPNVTGDTGSGSNSAQIRIPDDDLLGFNVYRFPVGPNGEIPTVEEIVNDANLVGSLPPDATTFTDNVSTSKGNNFCYAFTTVYDNGSTSGAGAAVCTGPLFLKDLSFRKGSLFFPLAGSSITFPAQLIINDKESYELQIDSTRVFLTIPKNERGSPSGLPIRKLIKRGVTVQLRIKGVGCNTPFTRPRK